MRPLRRCVGRLAARVRDLITSSLGARVITDVSVEPGRIEVRLRRRAALRARR